LVMMYLRAANHALGGLCRFLLAHLEKLQYLDYALVDDNETVQAREQYQDELEELKEVKAIEDAALAREAEQQKYLRMLKDANVIILEVRRLLLPLARLALAVGSHA
jgi:hypothetical protein